MSDVEIFKRPTNIQEMNERLKYFSTAEGRQSGLNYKPAPSDILIVTPAKCGTTWMQQIVHGLRTRGSMDFDEITRVVPWLEMAHDMGIDIHMPQVASPRAFKSHMPLDEVPKGGKYIVILRDPCDALLSKYRFFEDMFFERGSISLDAYARENYVPARDVHKHILAMWGRRKDSDVLALCYENMKVDLAGTIERVAQFIGVKLDGELREVVLRQSDIKFMQEHKEQFEDQIIRATRSAAMRLPPDGRLNKVRSGQVGESILAVPEEIKRELEAVWREEITPRIGLEAYDDFRQELMH